MESCSINCAWTTYRTTLHNNSSATNLYKDKKTLSQMPLKPLQNKTKTKNANKQIKADAIQHKLFSADTIQHTLFF